MISQHGERVELLLLLNNRICNGNHADIRYTVRNIWCAQNSWKPKSDRTKIKRNEENKEQQYFMVHRIVFMQKS